MLKLCLSGQLPDHRSEHLGAEGLPGAGRRAGDRRVIRVLLTDKGEQANALHSQFHARMIDSATQGLTEQELDALIQSLKNLSAFFQDMTTQAQNA